MSEPEAVREWMDSPELVHDFSDLDRGLVLDYGETRIRLEADNVEYIYREGDCVPTYEEDIGTVDPSHLEVYQNGSHWEQVFDGLLCLLGSVEGVPCEAYWKIDEIVIDA